MLLNYPTMIPRTIALKIRRRLIAYILKKQRNMQVKGNYSFRLPDGSRFDYPIDSVIAYELFNGGFEIGEVEFFRQTLKCGDVFLDIGANGGFFTVMASKQVGETGKVYAFEPGKRELDLLRNNIAVNKLNNVNVIEAAVGDRDTTTQFAISRDGALNSLLQTEHPDQKIESWQTVQMKTIDNFVRENNISKVDFIKVDVEGAEKLVFEGAKELLASSRKLTILFEGCVTNSKSFGYTVPELMSELIRANFSIKYINSIGILKDVSLNNPRLGKEIHNFIACK
jgi:FkbM family methyltransferase